MKRIFIISVAVGMFGGPAAFAGFIAPAGTEQIQVGQINGSGQNEGLTKAYMSGSASCIGTVVGGSPCVSPSNGWAGALNYSNSTFQDSTNGSSLPSPYNGYTASGTGGGTSGPAGSKMGASGVTFAMISDPTTPSFTEWAASNNTASPLAESMTIPIGIFGVTDVWTMLDQEFGIAGALNAATVTFNFASTSNATTGLTTVAVDLNNAGSGTATPGANGAQIQDSLDCTGAGVGTPPSAYSNCSQYANGALSASSNPLTYVNGVLQTTGVQVLTQNLYSFNYTNAIGFQYADTAGVVNMDDQGFIFGGAYSYLQNDYLVSITVTDNSALTYKSGTILNPNLDFLQLSGVTLDSTIPEPSSWVLATGAFLGLGVMGWINKRRNLSAK